MCRGWSRCRSPRACRCSDGGRRPARRGRARPRPGGAGDGYARAAALATSSPLLGADRVLSRALDLVRYASDASPYRLIPQVGRDGARRRPTSPRRSPTARRTGTPVNSPRRRHEPQRPGRRATASWSTSAATSPAFACWRTAPRVRVKPGHGPRPRQPRAGQAPAPPRPGPRLHGLRDGRRRDRQQLGRDALRRRPRRLPHAALADVRAALGHDDRHRRAGRRRALRARPSPSWPTASRRSATRSAPTPS